MSAEKRPNLGLDEIRTIRASVLMGLACYGELERLENAVTLLEMGEHDIPENLRPIAQSGEADTVSDFAQALLLLQSAEEDLL